MNLFFRILILFAISLSAQAQQNPPHDKASCAVQIPYGQPIDSRSNTTLICRTAYILNHDNVAKIPDWVSYVLIPQHATGCVVRSNAFAPDQSLPIGQRSELKDYARSGYDIGHQANDGDMSWDPTVERESFILSNMAPQLPGFNRGIWKKLEDQIRGWVLDRQHPLLVYVGPVYDNNENKIGPDNVVIAHAFYKIVIDTITKEAMVYEFPHKPSNDTLDKFIVPLQKVQQDTGIIFQFPSDVKFTNIWTIQDKSAVKAKQNACGR